MMAAYVKDVLRQLTSHKTSVTDGRTELSFYIPRFKIASHSKKDESNTYVRYEPSNGTADIVRIMLPAQYIMDTYRIVLKILCIVLLTFKL